MLVETNVPHADPDEALSMPLMDLESMVVEIGSTFPLMTYASEADESEEREAVDAAVLAGLVASY